MRGAGESAARAVLGQSTTPGYPSPFVPTSLGTYPMGSGTEVPRGLGIRGVGRGFQLCAVRRAVRGSRCAVPYPHSVQSHSLPTRAGRGGSTRRLPWSLGPSRLAHRARVSDILSPRQKDPRVGKWGEIGGNGRNAA